MIFFFCFKKIKKNKKVLGRSSNEERAVEDNQTNKKFCWPKLVKAEAFRVKE